MTDDYLAGLPDPQKEELTRVNRAGLNALREYLKSSQADLVKRIEDTKELSKDDEGLLHTAVKDFKKSGAY